MFELSSQFKLHCQVDSRYHSSLFPIKSIAIAFFHSRRALSRIAIFTIVLLRLHFQMPEDSYAKPVYGFVGIGAQRFYR